MEATEKHFIFFSTWPMGGRFQGDRKAHPDFPATGTVLIPGVLFAAPRLTPSPGLRLGLGRLLNYESKAGRLPAFFFNRGPESVGPGFTGGLKSALCPQ